MQSAAFRGDQGLPVISVRAIVREIAVDKLDPGARAEFHTDPEGLLASGLVRRRPDGYCIPRITVRGILTCHWLVFRNLFQFCS